MPKTNPTTIRLTEEDRAIAESIAHEIGSNMTGAIKYALRVANKKGQTTMTGSIPTLGEHYPEAFDYLERERQATIEYLKGAKRVRYSTCGDAGIAAGAYDEGDLLDVDNRAMARVLFDNETEPQWMDGRLLRVTE